MKFSVTVCEYRYSIFFIFFCEDLHIFSWKYYRIGKGVLIKTLKIFFFFFLINDIDSSIFFSRKMDFEDWH